jgi:hypothetical protein
VIFRESLCRRVCRCGVPSSNILGA